MALNRLEQMTFWLFLIAGLVWLVNLYGMLPFPHRALLVWPLAFLFGWNARRLFAGFMRFSYWLAGDR